MIRTEEHSVLANGPSSGVRSFSKAAEGENTQQTEGKELSRMILLN